MRISTSQLHNLGLNAILDQQAKLIRTQQQIATGKRVLNPSDDPSAVASSININQSIKRTEQFQENINTARSRQNLEEQTLAGINDIFNRIRELAIQGNKTSLTNTDRQTIASEIRQNLAGLLSLSNTQDSNGEYLFSGYQGMTQPFSVDSSGNYIYNGDNGQRYLQIGPGRQVAVSDSGVDVFQAIRNGNGSFTTRDNPANAGTGVIDPGTVINAAASDGDTYSITFPITTSATDTLVFGDNVGTDDDLNYTLNINGTTVYSVSESGTPVNTHEGLAAEINDDSATTGVKAYVANGTLYLGYTTPSTNPITVTEGLSGGSDGDLDTATGYFGSALSGTTTPNADIAYNAGDADFYIVEDSAGNLETSGAYTSGSQIAFNGIATNISGSPRTSDSFTLSPSTNQDLFTTVENLALALENGSDTPAGVAGLANAVSRALTDIDQSMNNVEQIRSQVGSRLKALDSQQDLNDAYSLQLQTTLSGLEDLDYADAITRLEQQLTGLQAAQQSFVSIRGLSLFNFL